LLANPPDSTLEKIRVKYGLSKQNRSKLIQNILNHQKFLEQKKLKKEKLHLLKRQLILINYQQNYWKLFFFHYHIQKYLKDVESRKKLINYVMMKGFGGDMWKKKD
jgi:hypothetical protein